FSFRPNCPNAPLLAPRVRDARSHSRARFIYLQRARGAKARASGLSSKSKSSQRHGAEVTSTKARSGAWLMQKKRGIQKC
ncbi:hypothetical protein, partial [Aquipseudomonas alcaligenes]|uniref:hypothetical protein n=1 Tax=Aquipseudomonas alcaligenes TaxID=43263 RepID=UPI0024323206